MKIIILAGGKGSRLWPMSRESWPKQFLKLNQKSLFEETLERNLSLVKPEDVFISTNQDYYFYIREITDCYNLPPENIILEPIAKNTAPAILFALSKMKDKVNKSEVIVIVPSDHFISSISQYKETIKKAVQTAKKNFITIIGLRPNVPETNFGYIKTDRSPDNDYFLVKKFIEKPTLTTAKKYLKSGQYFWNVGIFVFPFNLMIREYQKLSPQIFRAISDNRYRTSPRISIDKAIIEKSKRVAMVPAKFKWQDLGSWLAVHRFKLKEKDNNVQVGSQIVLRNSKNSLIVSQKRLIVGLGLEKMIVIDTPDALLVVHQDKINQLKNLVKELKRQRRPEALEHQTVYRPWGSYTILEEGEGYKVKRIVVKPKKKLSLQLHHRRSEHWVVIKGKARVQIGEKEFDLLCQQSTFVPVKTLHRLVNLTSKPVEIIEIQNGDYLGEDDIERFDDDFGRHKKDCQN